jgi:hypothetical protein
MPPRYSYWTILAGGLPTAFRAAEREELEPTFRRLREKHPDAEMKWFARGKLWTSPEEARIERPYRDEARGGGGRDAKPDRHRRESAPRPGEARGRDWRPGGEHRDPRQKFKDAKKARNLDRRQQKFARKQGADAWRDRPPREKPHGDPIAPRSAGDRRFDRPAAPRFDRPVGPPAFARPPRKDWRDRSPREKPHGDTLRPDGRRFREDAGASGGSRSARPNQRPRDDRGASSRPPPSSGDWRTRPPREKPHGDTFAPRGAGAPRFDRPSGPPRNDWRDRSPREKPPGDALRPEGRRFSDDAGRPGGPRQPRPERRPHDARGASGRPLPKGDWRARPPREKPHGDKLVPRGGGERRFDKPAAPPRGDWRDRAPREKPHGDPLARGSRPFDRKQFPRSQNVEEPPPPPRPRGPNREPGPSEVPPPSAPPRPSEPVVPPPGPPERGRSPKRKAPRQR